MTGGLDVGEDVLFHTLDGAVSEGMAQDPAFAGVNILVDDVVHVEGVLVRPEGCVEVALADVAPEAVDCLERCV